MSMLPVIMRVMEMYDRVVVTTLNLGSSFLIHFSSLCHTLATEDSFRDQPHETDCSWLAVAATNNAEDDT